MAHRRQATFRLHNRKENKRRKNNVCEKKGKRKKKNGGGGVVQGTQMGGRRKIGSMKRRLRGKEKNVAKKKNIFKKLFVLRKLIKNSLETSLGWNTVISFSKDKTFLFLLLNCPSPEKRNSDELNFKMYN